MSVTDAMDDDRDDHPSFLKTLGFVAIGVAATILIFFAIGYGFGRLFL